MVNIWLIPFKMQKHTISKGKFKFWKGQHILDLVMTLATATVESIGEIGVTGGIRQVKL